MHIANENAAYPDIGTINTDFPLFFLFALS